MAWGEPHLTLVLASLRELRLYVAVLIWWTCLLLIVVMPLPWALRAEAFLSDSCGTDIADGLAQAQPKTRAFFGGVVVL